MELNINKKDKIHLIGIGGIGMSGIALILKKWDMRFREVIYPKKAKV